MLLSTYASFRWARGKNYVQKTAVLIMIFSFLSTFFGSPISVYIAGPSPFLSFPFYQIWEERRLELASPYEYSYEVSCFDICFVTAPVFQFVPQGPVTGGGQGEGWVQVVSYRIVLFDAETGAIPSEVMGITLFLFFIAVNTLGALLGFLFSKTRIAEKARLRSKAFLGLVSLGIIILAYGIWLYADGTAILTGPWSRYYHSYPRYLPYYFSGAIACVIFGISWTTMILLDRARIFSRISNAFTQP
jgi:hypothetical protein